MTPLEREAMRRRAEAKLAAMRERAGRLRRRVLAGAAIGFVLLWAAIFAQMTIGWDPALGPATANVRAAARESVATDPERRALRAASPGSDEESEAEAAPLEEEERLEAEAETAEAEAAEAERIEAEAAAEAEELEAVTTGQS